MTTTTDHPATRGAANGSPAPSSSALKVDSTSIDLAARLAQIDKERAELAETLARKRAVEQEADQLALKQKINALPDQFGQPNLEGMLRLIADEASIQVRFYRVTRSQLRPVLKIASKTKPHTKGFRLSEHQIAQLHGLLRKRLAGDTTLSMSDIKKRFDVRSQTVYSHLAKVRAQLKVEARRGRKSMAAK